MKQLIARTIAGAAFLACTLVAAVFLAAWTLDYWQAWICLAVFFVSATAMSLYLVRRNPALLERRLKAGARAETEPAQKLIQSLTQLFFIALFIVSGLDRRFAWSRVAPWVSILGDGMMAAGFVIVFLVFKENTYASGVIEVAVDQRVISSGPYALVRHPMYSGALVMLAGIPLALGSWWGLLVFLLLAAGIVWRLIEEEKYLAANLPGYSDYRRKVGYRLMPMVW
jgi:protein-S-isoprenylcysteine O-methyltransferase Ste14